MWPLFLGLALLMIGNGLNGAVIGVRSSSEGFTLVVTGVIMAGYFAGFLLAPTLVVRMISSVGHIRVFAGLASTASTAVLIHSISVTAPTWVLMRFIFGFCFAGLYIVIESWLNELSTPQNRGRTLAIYMIVSMTGLGIGQALITVADPNTFRLFVLSSVLVSMALVPVTLAGNISAPEVRLPEKAPIRELLRIVPTGVVGAFMSGAATGVVFALSAVYATSVGLSIDRTALFLLVPMIGGVVMQWPVGKLSDRLRRRTVIFAVAVVASAVCAAGIVVPSDSALMLLVMFGVGGALFPLYSLVVSYTLDWTAVEKTVGTSGTLVRLNGAGALVGPLVTAPLMSWLSPTMFFWTMGAFFSVIVAFISYRLLFSDPLPEERESPYVPFPARATSVAFRLVTTPARVSKRVGKNIVGRRHEHRTADDRFERRTAELRHPSNSEMANGTDEEE
ncbi:MFS transporter [Ilumatobacter nonamiensis]|uniref:MFS transporter n=1 Tax=Ilumatobacter nonamiensis TaxID=467093 RepID=UPI00130E36C9|nr:MFS transporter [Ilumatobacter nonamiensis]